jgi:hypothetical protein
MTSGHEAMMEIAQASVEAIELVKGLHNAILDIHDNIIATQLAILTISEQLAQCGQIDCVRVAERMHDLGTAVAYREREAAAIIAFCDQISRLQLSAAQKPLRGPTQLQTCRLVWQR